MSFLEIFAVAWLASILLPLCIYPQWVRTLLAWLLPLAGIACLIGFANGWNAYERLGGGALLLLFLIKASALLVQPRSRTNQIGRMCYLTVWPGIDPSPFYKKAPTACLEYPFARGLLGVYFGVAGLLALSLASPHLSSSAIGWGAIVTILLAVHLGMSQVLTSLIRLLGFPTGNLFDRPLRSRSLMEFWTRRWNLAFVEMDRLLFLPALTRLFGLRLAVFGAFLISGALHELAISYPAGAGWGGPMLYFTLQGLGVLAEKRWRIRQPFFAWAWILLPLPLLFHTAFREAIFVPMVQGIHAYLTSYSLEQYVSLGLWLAGIAHFLVLMASFQVPSRLNWRTELVSLSSFNRKLMWAYGAYIVTIIIAFGALTLSLHTEFLKGSPAAVGIAVMITAFWGLRLLMDGFYYKSEDWPVGPQFQIGHSLLNSLFAFIFLNYTGFLTWHFLKS